MLRQSNFKFPFEYFHLNFRLDVFPLFKPLDWMFLCHCLNRCVKKWPSLEIQCLVMMDTHTHVLFRIINQEENFFTSELLQQLGQKSPQDILVEPIRNYSQYLNTYKYIYRNPVIAGVTERCENYVYSSLYSVLRAQSLELPIVDPMNVIQHPYKILDWLNSESAYKVSKLTDIYQNHVI